MAEYWWRSWHGAPTDLKWSVIAARAGVKVGVVSAIAWALLDFASQHIERGSVTGFDPEVYAAYSGFSEGEIIAVIQAMTEKNIIVNGRFSNWDKRQPKSETAIERATKSRMLRDVAPDCGMLRDVAQDTDTDTESDTDTDTEEEKSGASPLFDLFLGTFRRNGINPSTKSDADAILEIERMGASIDDLKEGIAWKVSNNNGKPVRYVSSLIGPTRTAMQRRLQKSSGGQSDAEKALAAQREWLARLPS